MLDYKRDIKELENEINEKFPIKIDYKYAEDLLERVSARCPDNISKAEIAKILKLFFEVFRSCLLFKDGFSLGRLIYGKQIYYCETLKSVKCAIMPDENIKFTIECHVEDIFK
jgi:hypothetical protein